MPEARRLLSDATHAFVDRSPIDWAALLSRVRTSPDRALFESLYRLDSIRDAARTARARETRGPSRLVFGIVALAALQTACSLAVVALAVAQGATAGTRVPQVVLALSFAGASLLLAVAAPRDARRLFLLATFASAASAFARTALLDLPAAWSASIDPVLRGIVPEAFTPACLWQFALDFPRVRRFTSFDVYARRATIVTWWMASLLFAVNLALAYHVIDGWGFAYLLRDHPGRLFWRLFTLALVPPVGAILVRSRRAPISERRKVMRLAMAIAVGTAPFLLSGLARVVLPGADQWLRSTNVPERLWLARLVVVALAATPILTTVAVVADRPFELQGALLHTLRAALARGAPAMVAATPFALLAVVLYNLRDVAIGDVVSGWRAALLVSCGLVACVLVAARTRLQRAIEQRAFARDRHEQHLTHALESLRLARGSREIAQVLRQSLFVGVGADHADILLPVEGGTFVEPSRQITRLPATSVLVAMLEETTGPLDLSTEGPVLALLPAHDREWVVSEEVALAAPITRRDGTLAALLLLGRRPGSPFDSRDRWLVRTLTTAAAAAWEGEERHGIGADASPDSAQPRHRDVDEAAFECPRCGRVDDSPVLQCSCGASAVLGALPRHLGVFLVERRIGAGGMGVVYRARDTSLDRDVALKTLPEARPGTFARLRVEARAMAALNHESLATIYGLEVWRRTPVLVVEYLPNGTLARRLADGALAHSDAAAVGIILARALAYMHGRGVLHRDLKPGNIAFTADGAMKLLDFGLVTSVGTAAHNDVTTIGSERRGGTPAYLPPEAFEGASPNAAFDLWGLAVVVLETITGVNPFAAGTSAGTMARVLKVDLGAASESLAAAPPALRGFLERALDRRPERRFESAIDVLRALEAVARTLPPSTEW